MILFRHDPVGLGGQISRRLLALKIAYLTGIKVAFDCEDLYPYDMCFEPLASTPPDVRWAELPRFSLARTGEAGQGDFPAKFDFATESNDQARLRAAIDFCPPELHGLRHGRLAFEGVLLNSMQLTPAYRAAVDRQISTMSLPKHFVAVHFRRGDKKVEAPYVPSSEYRIAIARVCEEAQTQQVFIASDSARACEELGLERLGISVIFDSLEPRYNNANHKFLMANPALRFQETDTAIKNIEILSSATRVVGQTNAHFATLAAARIAARSEEFGELLDGMIRLRNPALRFAYATNAAVRSVLRTTFPQFSPIERSRRR